MHHQQLPVIFDFTNSQAEPGTLTLSYIATPEIPPLLTMPSFIIPSPLLPVPHLISSSATPRRTTRRRLPVPRRPAQASATIPSRDTGSSYIQNESLAYEDLDWRRQNANLVSESQRNGIDSAIKMLWSMSKDGVAVTQNFNQVVSLLASHNRFEDGLELAAEAARRGLANIITFRPLMKYCCSSGDGSSAKRVWRVMSQYNINGDMFLYAELMGALVRAQDMVSAQRVVDSLLESGRKPHIVLYNTLLKGYAKKANVNRGFEVLRTVEDARIRPDETVRRSIFFFSFACCEAISQCRVFWCSFF